MSKPRSRRHALALLLPALVVAGCHDARNALGDVGIAAGAAPAIAAPARTPVPLLPPPHTAAALGLPADFPVDVFVPAGYSVNSVMDTGPLQVVSVQSPGPVAALFADARAAMRAQGWTQTLARQSAVDNAMVAFEKDGRAAVLSFDQTTGGRDVTTSVQLRRAQ